MPNGIYLTLEQYKDKDLPITITINGHTYHSQFALATAQTTWFEMGKQHGMELGSDNTYSDKEMSRMHNAWYNEGYEAGIDHGIEQTLQDDRVKEELERTKQTWYATGKEAGYGDGYEDGKKFITQEEFDRGWAYGYDAGKDWNSIKDHGYSVDDIKQLHTDNEFTRKIWYDKGKAEGYAEGYNDGYEQCKHDGISKKKIPGEYLSHIEEAYKEGYADCREVAKMLNKYGIDDDDSCKDCKEEPGRDDDEPIGPEQTEYAKGYEEGYAEGKEAGFEEGFMNLKLVLRKN